MKRWDHRHLQARPRSSLWVCVRHILIAMSSLIVSTDSSFIGLIRAAIRKDSPKEALQKERRQQRRKMSWYRAKRIQPYFCHNIGESLYNFDDMECKHELQVVNSHTFATWRSQWQFAELFVVTMPHCSCTRDSCVSTKRLSRVN